MTTTFNFPFFQHAITKAEVFASELGLNGHVLPPIGPYPKTEPVNIYQATGFSVDKVNEELSTQATGIFGVPMCFPLKLKLSSQPDSAWWLLPVEPMISISGSRELIRRKVAKISNQGKVRRGTIKEYWGDDDYSISIEGLLTKKDDWTYPAEDVRKLRSILEARETIDVECDLLEYFKIGRIAIEKYDLPFTKGEENQRYSVSAYSDDDWELLIKLDS